MFFLTDLKYNSNCSIVLKFILLAYKKLEKGEIYYEDKEVDNFLFIFIHGLYCYRFLERPAGFCC